MWGRCCPTSVDLLEAGVVTGTKSLFRCLAAVAMVCLICRKLVSPLGRLPIGLPKTDFAAKEWLCFADGQLCAARLELWGRSAYISRSTRIQSLP
ncbi:hypothetical protein CDL15_Pgr012662 [Punica granatum]|uniref:Uncharacterized protein n=1 Tax=Punica granatum TaxID=22663 RepID=A0A218WQK1_PUNGR|nr:hypothetical protein CDL15_Pgr012662 [Punica granatum]